MTDTAVRPSGLTYRVSGFAPPGPCEAETRPSKRGGTMTDTATRAPARPTPPVQDPLQRADPRSAPERPRSRQRDGGAPDHQDRGQHRCGRGAAELQEPGVGGQRPLDHRRPEAGDHEGQEVAGQLQAAAGQRHRLQGHPPGRQHVGVLRSAGHPGHPPHPRLPGLNPRSFDGNGNYTFGLTEQLVFPEIDYDTVDSPGAWTSRSSPPLRTTHRAKPCSTLSTSHSGAKGRHNKWLRRHSRTSSARRRSSRSGPTPGASTAAAPRSVYRRFNLCRVCLRNMAHAGEIPGVTKASW